jgi:hypothetical protein
MGAFMHTINHPKAQAVVALAKTVSLTMGISTDVWKIPLEITDTLANHYQWPVYPEIAKYFSIPGSFDWVNNGKHYDLEDFIEVSYANYVKAGIARNDIELSAPPELRAHFDRVLSIQARNLV